MQVQPKIMALRRDPSPQRLAQQCLEQALGAWRKLHRLGDIEAELGAYASGIDFDELAVLAGLFGPGTTGSDLVDGFVSAVSAAIRAHPFAQLGLRHFLDERTATLMLARRGSATLTLLAIGGTALPTAPPETVIFTQNQSIERVIAGSARAALVRGAEAPDRRVDLIQQSIDLRAGTVLHRDGSREALQFTRIDGVLVLLKLQRRLPGDEPAREYALTSGALVNQAAGNPRDSRIELAAALLGRMGRSDAAPYLAAIAEEHGGDSLRWQALRECLGLDTAAGFGSLCRLAANAADPLAVPAGALRAQLLEAWPQLTEIDPCLAS